VPKKIVFWGVILKPNRKMREKDVPNLIHNHRKYDKKL